MLGPLAHLAEPHSYDLCSDHADGLTAPRGWEVVRLVPEFPTEPAPSPDDLSALAEAVREAGRTRKPDASSEPRPTEPGVTETARRGHLRVLRAEE